MRKILSAMLVMVACGGSAVVAETRPSSVVLGYSAAWQDQNSPPADYPWAGITHVVRAFVHPNEDGTLIVPSGFFNPAMESAAHQHGVKLLISLGGGAEKADNWLALATHPDALNKCMGELDQLLTEHHYDGVDVDWEPMPANRAEAGAYTSFLRAVRQRMPHAVITTALDDWVTTLDWPAVLANVDYVNVMTYDYAGPWTGVARHATNLHPPGDCPPVAGHSVEEGLHKLIDHDHLPPTKLLVGLNFWGYRFKTDRLGASFDKTDESASDNLCYQQVLDLLETGHYQALWDEQAQVPYLQRTGGGSVVVYDNPESIRRKCEYAKTLGCAGMMIWGMGSDVCGTQSPLMDAVLMEDGVRPPTLGRSALEAQVSAAIAALKELDRKSHVQPSNDRTPQLSTLSQEQLETLNARLQLKWGMLDDSVWRGVKAAPTD